MKNRIAHPVLGYTLDPSALSDVDASGFRNPQDKGLHEIVVIGDSHTYGDNVEWKDAWPYKLGRSRDKSVYNYGVGGYGIYHYLYLAKEAVRHKPEYVLLGLFSHNDIEATACSTVSPDYYQDLLERGITKIECPPPLKPRLVKDVFEQYSALMSALSYVKWKYLKPILTRKLSSEDYFDFEGILINKFALSNQNKYSDLSQKIVKGNYDASKNILSLINNELRGNGIKFGVVIIPSREVVIEQWAINNGVEIPENFSVKPQKKLIDKYIAFLNKKSIPAIDATPFVVTAFAKSAELKKEIYPLNDGHPFAEGYESYSRAGAELISKINQNEIKADGGSPRPSTNDRRTPN